MERSRNWFWRPMTSGSDKRRPISSWRSSSFSSLRRIESFMPQIIAALAGTPVAFFRKQARQELCQGGIGGLRGLAQRLGGGVQQPVRQGIGEVFDHLVGG